MTTDEARAVAKEAGDALSGPIGNAERTRLTGALVGAVGELAAQLDAAKPATKAAPAKADEDDDDEKKPAKKK
jgi:hypothetical protein